MQALADGMRRLYNGMGQGVHTPYATPLLAALFYIEAIFFIPTDPILILYCIENSKRAFFYATVATIASVAGGITSYAIGYYLWQQFGTVILNSAPVNYILSERLFHTLATRYQENETAAILIAGFTPIPYKAATLAAGICKLSLAPFIICSIIARGSRFFLLAGIISLCGVHAKHMVERYFGWIMIGAVILIIGTVYAFASRTT